MLNSKSKKVLSVALAFSVLVSGQALVASAVSAKSAASSKALTSVQTTAKPAAPRLAISNIEIMLDGKQVTIESVSQSNATLVNARTLTQLFGGTLNFDSKSRTLTLRRDKNRLLVNADNKFVVSNNIRQFITHAPRVVQQKYFIEINHLVRFLGGEVLADEDGNTEYTSFRLLTGAVNPHWLNANTVLVSKQGTAMFEHYLIDTATRKPTKLNISVDTENLIPSPDSKHVAYTDENSNVYVYTFETNTEKKITDDTNEKLDLQWASDLSGIFYIDGPRQNVIAKVTLEGLISKIVDDKVDYKSDLVIHSNNTQFLYSVTKTGKTTADTTGVIENEELPDFDVNIDLKGTEPQLYTFDSTVENATPKLLTSTTDNKTYSTLLANGTVAYLSTETETEEPVTNLKLIDKDSKLTTIILANTELTSIKLVNNKLLALGYTTDDEQFIFEIDPIRGSAKKLADLPLEITAIHPGMSNEQVLAEDEDGKLAVWKDEKWVILTR